MDEQFLEKIEKIIDFTKSVYNDEKQKINKDDILIIFISISRYLIDKTYYDKALSLLTFVEEKINKTLRFYEDAIFLKMVIYERLKNKAELEKAAENIKLYTEFLIRKYQILMDFYFEMGDKENSEKILQNWQQLIKLDSLYRYLDYKLVSFDLLYRTAKYSDLINELNELENNELKQCLLNETPYATYIAGRFYSMKGLTLYAKEMFSEALAALIKSSEYFKKYGFQSNILSVYNNIGEIYKLFKKYDQANSIYEKIINTAKYLGDKDAEAAATWNIGESYFFLKDFAKAEEYFTEGEKLFFEAGSYERYSNYLKIFFAKLYIETSRFDSAEGLIDEVLMNAFEREEMKEYADALTLKGLILGKKGEDVTHYFEEAIDIYKNLGAKIELKEAETLKIHYSKK
ncbi:MAG: tetratricopeptide repeat protein [Spirochaetales bacterium]|nr:tetratricopeptide repeat protein [Spirochaetales bacterium]